jgi:hypothetical protein
MNVRIWIIHVQGKHEMKKKSINQMKKMEFKWDEQ